LKIKNGFLPFFLLILFSCELEKTIDLELPDQERKLVAEAYLERDKELRVLLMETDSYFDTLRFPFLNDAEVILSSPEANDTLRQESFLDIQNLKFFNYVSGHSSNKDGIYKLKINSAGRILEGNTRFLPKPILDTIEIQYNTASDSTARFLFWIKDFAGESNFYRIIMNEDSLTGNNVLEFTFTDNGNDGKLFPIGTSYRFDKNKNYILRLFHIEQQYYLYLRAMSAADRSNGNPFAQPSTIQSPMKGDGYGIFTTLNYLEKTLRP
jgi:hypothetical protein